jgi:type IV pilus assembly protein PilV
MRAHTKAGFSLVEVLVSVLILSIGVIGAASMQLTALRNNQESAFHGIALRIATEVADQIRAVAADDATDLENSLLSLDFKGAADAPVVAESCSGVRSMCDRIMLNASQLYEIESRLQTMLPRGRIKVCRDNAPWDSASNAYTWECQSDEGNAPLLVKIGWHERVEGVSAASVGTTGPQLVLLVQA